MTYLLHYAPCNASLVVRLALDQIGVPYRCVLVDRSRNAQRSDAYTALIPNGLIPTLEADQGVIFETGAILLWLADRHGGLGPAPNDNERVDFLKWFFFVSNTVHPTLRQLFYPEPFIAPDPAHQAILGDRAQHALMAHHTKLNTLATQGRRWFAYETPTALDFYIAATLRWPAIYPTDQNHSWHSIANYHALHDMCLRLEAMPVTQGLIKAKGMNATPFTAPEISNPPKGSAT